MPPAPPAPAPDATLAPRSLADLFWSFTWLALQGFGGVMAVAQRELVERKRWLTREQFVEEWAVAQIMPGPNVVNLCMMLGDRFFGLRGALAALAGMLALPTVLVLALALLYASVAQHPLAQGALRGMGAVAAGLVLATGIKLAGALRTSPMGVPACTLLAAAAFVAIAWLRWPLGWVLLLVGGAGMAWAWRCLAPPAARDDAPRAALTDADSGHTP
ncbi:MAG: chromate transporter [Pseudomonadota bacterium]|nr:chromate transporter [Pseudomonadota bacterium]